MAGSLAMPTVRHPAVCNAVLTSDWLAAIAAEVGVVTIVTVSSDPVWAAWSLAITTVRRPAVCNAVLTSDWLAAIAAEVGVVTSVTVLPCPILMARPHTMCVILCGTIARRAMLTSDGPPDVSVTHGGDSRTVLSIFKRRLTDSRHKEHELLHHREKKQD
jgi:hypothetical protein